MLHREDCCAVNAVLLMFAQKIMDKEKKYAGFLKNFVLPLI